MAMRVTKAPGMPAIFQPIKLEMRTFGPGAFVTLIVPGNMTEVSALIASAMAMVKKQG